MLIKEGVNYYLSIKIGKNTRHFVVKVEFWDFSSFGEKMPIHIASGMVAFRRF